MPPILLLYLILINLFGLVLYGVDKAKSKHKGNRRIPERVLLWTARLGGGLGCWMGMMLFRHKTKHMHFVLGFPLIFLLQWGLLLLLWLPN